MSIPNEIIDQIRLSTDIVELIREYVPNLKKAGRNWRGLCPFHHEKTPSFMISSEKGIFHCFGCHVGGDAFKFLMLMDNLTWPEAIRKLAHRAGIAVKEETKENLITKSEKQKVYDLLESAGEFYHRCLTKSDEGAGALKYLKTRGVDESAITKFLIGFAPKGLLQKASAKKGFNTDQLIKAGLVTKTERGNIYEYMSERLVFPIVDAQGRIVAFGGRTLKDEQPKYLNTPETIVYSKSNQLYGLYHAIPTLRQDKEVFILEGYMDVVMTHQHGFANTVATLGTSLTLQHSHMLGRYAENVTLLFDSDNAGKAAAKRAIDVFLDTELSLKVVILPDDTDPDEYILENGKEGLSGFIKKNGRSAIEFLIDNAISAYGLNSKAKIVADIIPFLDKVKNAIVKHEWVKLLSGRLNLSEDSIRQEMKRQQKGKFAQPGQKKNAAVLQQMRSVEEEILQVITNCPECRPLIREEIFKAERNRKVCSLLLKDVHTSEIIGALEEEDARWFSELILEEKNYSAPEQMLSDLLKDQKQRGLEVERKQLEKEIVLMLDGSIPADNGKMQLYQELNKQLKGSIK